MIYRSMYVAYSKHPEQTTLVPDCPHYAALAFDGEKVFLYVEANEPTVDPNAIAAGDLIPYPTGRCWDRAIEIFHYSKPMSAEQWKRSGEKTPRFRLNRLQPEKTASYIYYHFQYQEEYPGDGDRYGVIYLHGDQLIFYLEDPTEQETVKTQGLLSSTNSPLDIWQELMHQHFADEWRSIDNLTRSDFIAF